MMRRPAASSWRTQPSAFSARADVDEHVEHRSRRAAVQRALQRADRAGHGAHHVGARAGDDPRGERRRVHAVVDHRDPVRVERAGGDRVRAPCRSPCRGSSPRATGRCAARSVPAPRTRACTPRRSWEGGPPASSRSRRRRHARCRSRWADRATASHTPCAAHRSAAPAAPPPRGRRPWQRPGSTGGLPSPRRAPPPPRGWQVPRPQQVRGLFERDLACERLEFVAADDEDAVLAIDVAEPRLDGDNAVEAALSRRHASPPVSDNGLRHPDFGMAVEILQQRIDRRTAARGVGPGPPIRAEARTRLAFRLLSEVPHRFVDDRDAACVRSPRRGHPGSAPPMHRRP